jgi:photosystem II stability/assembly factor-like uncharacterized protein
MIAMTAALLLFLTSVSLGNERVEIAESFHDAIAMQKHIVIVGDKGAIYHAAEDSIKKITLPNISNFWLKSIYFTDQSNGWIAGSSGSVLKTTDGGLSWNYIPTFFDNNFHACAFKDSLTGLVAGSDGIILLTKDGGKNWRSIHKKLGATIFDLAIVNETKIFAVGQSGYAALSDNFGTSWSKLKIDSISENHNLYGIKFLNSQTGLIYGANGTLLFTHDGGTTWSLSPQQPDLSIRDLVFKEDLIIAAGDSGKIGFSRDSGKSWLVKQILPGVDFYSISEIETNSFTIVGTNGAILKLSLEQDEAKSIDIRISRRLPTQNFQLRSERFRDSFVKYFDKSIYKLDPLGEGESDFIDKDPRFDFDRVDCVTITEQSLSLSISEDSNEFLFQLDKIRYRSGNVSFFNRNHFFVPDWIPANSWLIEDVTTNFGGNLSEKLIRTIGRQKFFALKNISIPQVKDDVGYETFYIPRQHVAKAIEKIDQPMIVSFIGNESWLFSLHVGMVYQDSDRLMLRHASMSAGKVIEEPFLPYLTRMKRFIGIKLLKIYN